MSAQPLADELSRRVVTVEQWLKEQARSDERVTRLQTHPGVGLLTSLCLVHTLGELTRFSSTRKVAAYVGFDPVEHSSAERKVYGGISKAGSRLLRYLLVEAGQTACQHIVWTSSLSNDLHPNYIHPRIVDLSPCLI